MERRLVYDRAAVLAAQIRRARRQRHDFVPRREACSVRQDVGALVREHNFLDRLRRPSEAQRPSRVRLDELERHVLVVADIPSVDSGPPAGGRAERTIGSLGPGNAYSPRLLADLDLRLIGQPSALIWKSY